MGENNKIINSETKIEFTIGKFIGLLFTIISSLLGLFIGFYFMVFEPRVTNEIKNLKEYYTTIQEKDNKILKEQLKPYLDKTDKMSQKITNIEDMVDGISRRFDDLNKIENQNNNTGGLSK